MHGKVSILPLYLSYIKSKFLILAFKLLINNLCLWYYLNESTNRSDLEAIQMPILQLRPIYVKKGSSLLACKSQCSRNVSLEQDHCEHIGVIYNILMERIFLFYCGYKIFVLFFLFLKNAFPIWPQGKVCFDNSYINIFCHKAIKAFFTF